MSTRTVVGVEGTLSKDAGDVYPARLNLIVAQLGASGLEDETIARVELTTRVPDGDYVLDYLYMKPFHGRVRVKQGVLIVP